MEERESVLEAIYEEENEDFQDVDMLDVGDGEGEEQNKHIESIQSGSGCSDDKMAIQASSRRNQRRKSKKKNKKKNNSMSSVTDINRFVIDTCRHLKERKSYLVWNAIGCLGVSAVSDLVNEVGTIQACGGQMTADGKRFRNGGGILWSILKTREPKAFKEIMAKGKEFEKQFRQQNTKEAQDQNKGDVAQRTTTGPSEGIADKISNGSQLTPQKEDEATPCDNQEERVSVLNRIRVPVAYDDLFQEDPRHDFESLINRKTDLSV